MECLLLDPQQYILIQIKYSLPINNELACNPCLRKSTKNDSVGRYSILHLLVYHCFDYEESKGSHKFGFFSKSSHWLTTSAYLPNGLNLCTNNTQVDLHTVLWCPFNPGLVFLCICTQAIDVKPATGAASERSSGGIDTPRLFRSLSDTYQDGIDILMFSETGMVGLQTSQGQQ